MYTHTANTTANTTPTTVSNMIMLTNKKTSKDVSKDNIIICKLHHFVSYLSIGIVVIR